ncbi:MAG: hypothetical protein ACK41D_00320 [Rubricoccaceae bacterium]
MRAARVGRGLAAMLGLLALAAGARAQGAVPVATLEARVADAETGEELPGATAQDDASGRGATANASGVLRLPLERLPARVVVRFVGYAPAVVVVEPRDVDAGGVARRTVRLEPQPATLGEAVVFAEDPGDRLWRRVLARRDALAARLGAYTAETYSRLLLERQGSLERVRTPVRLAEALTTVAWRHGAGARELVVARHRLPAGGPYRYADAEPFPDFFFEHELWLEGRRVPGPAHPDALRYYRFRIGETVEEGGRRFVELAVLPRQTGLLSGRVRVVDSLLVIAEAELRLQRSGPAPVGGLEATYRAWFSPVETPRVGRDSLWLPERFERSGSVDVSAAGVRLPTVYFTQRGVATLRLPGVDEQDLFARPERYRSPAGVYAGRAVYDEGRARWPLGDAERHADRTLGPRSLSEMLFREGLLRQYVPLPVEGRDAD